MFISKKEKAEIEHRLLKLEARVELLARSLNSLHDIKTMSSDNSVFQLKKTKKELQLEKRRIYAREYYKRKREEQVLAELINHNQGK